MGKNSSGKKLREEWDAARAAQDVRALARWISRTEREPDVVAELLETLEPTLGRSEVYGITGLPGAGKSTLLGGMIRAMRAEGKTVAVLAVDPNSPFHGGALLGDRVRLSDHYNDPGVFIRSLGTRGALGGLSVAARMVVDLFDAFGFDRVLVETVGVGQTEIEVRFLADVTAILLTPDWGDGIQAIKAGILEIGDFFVVNKADRPGADRVVAALEEMLEFSGRRDATVLRAEALKPDSAAAVAAALSQRRATLGETLVQRRAEANRRGLQELIEGRLRVEVAGWLEKAAQTGAARYTGYRRFVAERSDAGKNGSKPSGEK